jgi:hypothetical protein
MPLQPSRTNDMRGEVYYLTSRSSSAGFRRQTLPTAHSLCGNSSVRIRATGEIHWRP